MQIAFAPPEETYLRLRRKYPFTPYGKGNPSRVLLSCILSARTKDELTYPTADELFKKYPTPKELCSAPPQDVETLLKPLGFFRQKAKHIREAACFISEKDVPKTTEELLLVPGIGPKCAAIVRAFGWGIPDIAVDTHVFRISKRLGWTTSADTLDQTQKKLKLLFPINQWVFINHLVVSLGRDVCRPQRPLCNLCVLSDICPYPSNP